MTHQRILHSNKIQTDTTDFSLIFAKMPEQGDQKSFVAKIELQL
jgi:hypothetical protein